MRPEKTYLSLGLFVSGALILLILGGLFLYTQYINGRVETYVMFFKGSLNGLETKSAVTYRGVKIGEVKRIELTASKSNTNVSIPVYVEFFIEKSFVQRNNPIHILIANNIKASITSPNLLTGMASIELDKAETPSKNLNYGSFRGVSIFPTESLSDDEAEVTDTFKVARKTFKDISSFVRSKEMKDTLAAIHHMASSIEMLSKTLDTNVPGMAVLVQKTLQQWTKTGYTTQNLTDYLSRHPEALLRGKP